MTIAWSRATNVGLLFLVFRPFRLRHFRPRPLVLDLLALGLLEVRGLLFGVRTTPSERTTRPEANPKWGHRTHKLRVDMASTDRDMRTRRTPAT